MRNGITRGIPILALALAVALAAAGAAQEKPAPVHGVQVAIDPVTGQLRPPTPEEAQALSASIEQLFRQPTEGLKVEQRADGTLVLDLQGGFFNAALLQKSADGSLKLQCTNDLRQARISFGLAPAPQPQPAKETE